MKNKDRQMIYDGIEFGLKRGDPFIPGSYITFRREWAQEVGKATTIWTVSEGVTYRGSELGQVRWFPRWRKYSFYTIGGSTVFEETCLRLLTSARPPPSTTGRVKRKLTTPMSYPQFSKAKFKVGDLVQTGCPPVGQRHDGIGRIKAVGVCTAEIDGRCISLGVMYQVGSREFLERQLKFVRRKSI